jgi:hypothetical protein
MADTALDAIKYLRDTAIAAETDAASRIYLTFAPQSASYPKVVMDIVSRVESPSQDLGSEVDVYRIQVDVFAKNGSARSGFDQAATIMHELREAWSRTGNNDDYNNVIDSVQEVGYRTDFLIDASNEGVFLVSSDYLIRVGAGSATMVRYSTEEQVWPKYKWINSETIYWRTWNLGTGNNSYEDLTGLLIANVSLVLPMSAHISTVTATGERQISGVLLEQSGTVYKIYTHSGTSDNFVTLYYTKV